jgi:hypothetical protein
MEDKKNRRDKTFGDLTVADAVVIGVCFYTIRFCGRILLGATTPTIVKAAEKIRAKTEMLKNEAQQR